MLSRLTLAALISLRAVLVYGEAANATATEVTWRDLLPARMRVPRPELAPAPAARVITGP